MQLPRTLGRAMSQSGLASGFGITTWKLGQHGGVQTPSIVAANLPDHAHRSFSGTQFISSGLSGFSLNPGGSLNEVGVTGGISGGAPNTGFDVTQPSSFMNYFIKL